MIRRPKNPPQIVFCSSDVCPTDGARSEAHLISADCVRPVTALVVVCDAHTRDGAKFVPHRQNFTCRNAVPVAADTTVAQPVATGVGR